MIRRSVSIVPSIPADNKCNVCVTQPRQLICLLYQVWFPSGELLRFGFFRVWHAARALLDIG